LIDFHYKIVESVSLDPNRQIQPGKQAVLTFYSLLRDKFRDALLTKLKIPETTNGNLSSFVRQEYEKNFDKDIRAFGNYFRYLFHILRYIDSAKRLSIDEKKEYVEILRAQLSGPEIVIIGFHGITDYSPALKPLIEKYGLLRDLVHEEAFRATFARIYESAFGSEDVHSSLPYNPDLTKAYYRDEHS
jgi:hypothetical protein